MSSELRPKSFRTFIGQKKIKNTLKVMIASAVSHNKNVDHVLLHGPPGTGKTTLASIIAHEAKRNIKYIQGSLLEKKADIISLLSNLDTFDILFIDEFHSISKQVEELIYSVMEDFVIDIIIGAEANSKILRLKIKPFTLIGATTKIEKISKPFKDRFGFVANLHTYNEDDLMRIAKKSLKTFHLEADEDALKLIISYCQNTPRILNHLIKRLYDFSLYRQNEDLNKPLINHTFSNLGLYKYGLNEDHIKYLCTLKNFFVKRPASLAVLSNLLKESREKLYTEIEPLLVRYNLIIKTSRGRKLTENGIAYTKSLECKN